MLAHVFLFLVMVASPAGADWPQWRGPTHDGRAADEKLADYWPPEGPPVLWSREVGAGYSAWIIADGRAYTQAQSLYEQYVLCVDAATGVTLWTHSYGWPFDGGTYPGPRATPTVRDGRLYFVAPNGLVGCLDARTGDSQWTANPKEKYGGKGTDFGVSASPLVVDGLVILPVGGANASLIALRCADGTLVWKAGARPASYATPVRITFNGKPLIVAALENSLLGVDAATGRVLWEENLSAGYDEHSVALIYREPRLMLAAPFRSGATAYRLVAEGTDGCRLEREWDSRQMSNDIASSVLAGDVLYGFDLKEPQARQNRPSRGEFRALDFNTGKTLWSSKEPGHANIIAADGKLLLFNDRGEVLLLKQSAERYKELARAAVFQDEVCWTPPALCDGRLFLRTQTRAVCLYVGRGSPPASTRPPATVAQIPQLRRIDPQQLLGGEREFPATPPDGGELQRWFAWQLLGLASAYLLAAGLLFRHGRIARHALFFATTMFSGIFGGALVNRLPIDFVFTPPLALWALGQMTLEIAHWAQTKRANAHAGRLARGAMLVFIAGCGLYFHFCRRLGLSIEWCFLTGFLPAFPLMVLSARWSAAEQSRWWLPPLGCVLSFAAYFWGCAAFMHWRLVTGT